MVNLNQSSYLLSIARLADNVFFFLGVPSLAINFLQTNCKQVMHKWLLGVLFYQNWLAYDVLPAPWNFTEQGKLRFSGLGAPTSENNYAFCQVRNLDVNTSYISL